MRVRGWIVGPGLVVALLHPGLGCGTDDSDDAADTATSTSGVDDDGGTQSGADAGMSSDTSAVDGSGGDAMRPNWHQDIAPFVAEHCRHCHTDDGIAFSMGSYAQTFAYAEPMAQHAQMRIMPPWHGVETDECQPPHAYKHDPRLTEEQIQLLRDWADLQAPEGDPADAVAIPTPPATALANPNAEVGMGGALTIDREGDVLDFFHCLSYDPGNTEDVFLDGLQIAPGNSKIAHHALLFIDTNADSAGWANGISENCGGGAGVNGAQLVGGWVPRALPIETPASVGIRLPAGARIILNMHYHASVVGPETDDATAVALRWTTTPPEYVSEFYLIGAPGAGNILQQPFQIPAGESAHQEVVEYTVPNTQGADVRIWSIANHMHKVGIDMKSSIISGGNETCLVQTPGWDFEWQRLYAYDVPIEDTPQVQTGDVVRVRCTYDNTFDNAALAEAMAEVGQTELVDVALGEGTLDEMCLAGVGVAIKIP